MVFNIYLQGKLLVICGVDPLENGKWLKETLLLYALSHLEPLGRRTLSRILRVTEGTVRNLTSRFKEYGYIRVDKTGVRITSEGRDELKKRLEKMRIKSIRDFPQEGLKIGPTSIAILIDSIRRRKTIGLEERDQAVRAGALGAVTITYSNGIYSIPGVYENLEYEAPNWYRAVSNTFKPENEAYIIVVFGENRWIATEAAFSIAIKIVATEI